MIEALVLACFVNCGAPPKRFVHPFAGKVVIVREFMPDHDGLRTLAWTFGNVHGRCVIHLNTAKHPPGISTASTITHEIAHCNGWPANHPR